MDLTQQKLTKKEWEGTEIPVGMDESRILKMLVAGYADQQISNNRAKSLFNHLKIPRTADTDLYLFSTYIIKDIASIIKKYGANVGGAMIDIVERAKKNTKKIKMKQSDIIRIQQAKDVFDQIKDGLYEFILLDVMKSMIRAKSKGDNDKTVHNWYTLNRLTKNNVSNINSVVMEIVNSLISSFGEDVSVQYMLRNAEKVMEKNKYLNLYMDETLYAHQKEIYSLFDGGTSSSSTSEPRSRLAYYCAPTSTGKTLTPLGLSEKYRIIFVCAARHVGLALARSAISMNKKVAFAFGASCAEDIRLHYYAAKDYTRDRKSGGIRKVDNTVGDKVEIMICDLKSYIPAMHYMQAFNESDRIIMYWDEPTITLDYETHACHEHISTNWRENTIPNIILSSATLPSVSEIHKVGDDFRARFANPSVTSITSHDCKKTIPILSRDGLVTMPHYIFPQYDKLLECAERCIDDQTALRHLDLHECVMFIGFVHDDPRDICGVNGTKTKRNKRYHMNTYYESVLDMTPYSVKIHYLELLKQLDANAWETEENSIYKFLNDERISRNRGGKVGANIATSDASSLTHGPTIFLANDVRKIGQYCLHQSEIPSGVLDTLMKNIKHNNKINTKLGSLEKDLESMQAKTETKFGPDGKAKSQSVDMVRESKEMKALSKEIAELEKKVLMVDIGSEYVPNRPAHIKKMYPRTDPLSFPNAFTSDINSDVVERIMLIDGVDDIWKILLLMGIGVFASHEDTNPKYIEVMKEMADTQKLFAIIASTDYIYGLNYQFCHGYIGSDLSTMTQQKITQGMGRIGRAASSGTYSVRFRSDDLVRRYFAKNEDPVEANNMNRLFGSSEGSVGEGSVGEGGEE